MNGTRRARSRAVFLALSCTAGLPAARAGQQVADTAFRAETGPPAWPDGRGPRVAVDESHGNFHTIGGRYAPFARVARADGFEVVPFRGPFEDPRLAAVDVLVVANALHESNRGAWRLPTPSAFTEAEIAAVRRWVEGGGSLLLIADHMPFPGAAADLAAAFGFTLTNGFVFPPDGTVPLVFRRADGSLADHPVTRSVGRVDSVATFTGEAFRVPPEATSLLTLPAGLRSLNPDSAWVFPPGTPSVEVGGWSQGAVRTAGRGRVAVFGEAAMFSAQRQGTVAMGMNAPVAGQNPAFLVGLLRWLAGDARSN